MSRLTQGHHWLGRRLADLIKHEGVHIHVLIYDACFSLSDHCKSDPDETMCSDQSLIFTVLGQRRRALREDVGLEPKGDKPSICYQLLVRR